MKVLLKKDVAGQGKAGEIVNVSDGYGRNYLIPRGLAVAADAETLNAARIRRDAETHRVKQQRERAKALADEVSKLTVKVRAKAGENGRLFGSVTTQEIAAALKEQYDITIDKRKIRLDEPIRQVGVVTVTAHMYENENARFKVEVIAE
ncbi:MAG: 50S ribosomal protein L9 [Clostridia bacterium]|nr:50S ribosomal protein L9 [Clostridia bacterium]